MAYTAPTLATFIAIFPSFASVEQAAYDFWAGQAVLLTEPRQACFGAQMDLATMRATAWYLTDAGIGTGTEAEMAAQGAQGFSRIKSGSIELERAKSDTAKGAGQFASNSYGLQFWAMLKPCLGGPIVTATGSLPCASWGAYPFRY